MPAQEIASSKKLKNLFFFQAVKPQNASFPHQNDRVNSGSGGSTGKSFFYFDWLSRLVILALAPWLTQGAQASIAAIAFFLAFHSKYDFIVALSPTKCLGCH